VVIACILAKYPADTAFYSAEYFARHLSFNRVQAAITAISKREGAAAALRTHWPEYLMETAALGMFMVSACFFGVLLGHPASAVYQALPHPLVRQILGGIAMGLTAVAIISSPWGKQSGAHMNPALTLTFLSLGKIAPWDALFYVIAQFAGGLAGVVLSLLIIGHAVGDPSVNYVATVPGPQGPWVAFAAEFAISFLLIAIILNVSNSRRMTRFTPWVAGFLVASYISIESPLSGMSMNPARTVGSALPAGVWTAIWVYFLAPVAAMLSAGQLYRHFRGAHRIFCAKFHHHNTKRCIFRCGFSELMNSGSNPQ
jgi:aquaporin Z